MKTNGSLLSAETRHFDPKFVSGHENLIEICTAIGAFDKTRAAYGEMLRQGLDDDSPHIKMFAIGVLEHDSKTMQEQAAWSSCIFIRRLSPTVATSRLTSLR